jgi:hypothetical protein
MNGLPRPTRFCYSRAKTKISRIGFISSFSCRRSRVLFGNLHSMLSMTKFVLSSSNYASLVHKFIAYLMRVHGWNKDTFLELVIVRRDRFQLIYGLFSQFNTSPLIIGVLSCTQPFKVGRAGEIIRQRRFKWTKLEWNQRIYINKR